VDVKHRASRIDAAGGLDDTITPDGAAATGACGDLGARQGSRHRAA
jgi:hypothetical protein